MEDLIKLINDIDNYSLIGPHVRHSIESYRILLSCHYSMDHEMSYETKERDFELQNDEDYAINTLEYLQVTLPQLNKANRDIKVDGMRSTIERESAYCDDHLVHHLAIIRFILRANNIEHLISDDFGVSKGTLTFRKEVK